jgi:hypothetical protein
MSAGSLITRIREKGGRVYRTANRVFVLTDDRDLANWLVKLGGKPYVPQGADPKAEPGSYQRARGGPTEWDIVIDPIPVTGETSIWEALA